MIVSFLTEIKPGSSRMEINTDHHTMKNVKALFVKICYLFCKTCIVFDDVSPYKVLRKEYLSFCRISVASLRKFARKFNFSKQRRLASPYPPTGEL